MIPLTLSLTVTNVESKKTNAGQIQLCAAVFSGITDGCWVQRVSLFGGLFTLLGHCPPF